MKKNTTPKNTTSRNTTPRDPTSRKRKRSGQQKVLIRRLLQIGVYVLVQAVILFATAGTIKWAAAWAYLILYLAFIAVNALFLIPKDTGLIEERSRIKTDVKSWDLWVGNLTILLGLAILFVAGLDQRMHWSDFMPLPIKTFAWVMMATGDGLFAWAMYSNPFFSAVVRIQKDRGHVVVRDGPYQFVRHPAYAGQLLNAVFIPLQLGSLIAFLPAALFIAALFLRTSMEDHTLMAELEGYAAYAKEVTFRIIPGIW